MKKAFRLFLGFLISATCLYFALRNFQFSDLKNSISQGVWIWMIPTLLLYFVNYFWRTLRWKLILKPITQIPFFRLFFILTLGFFVNNILPFRAGEVARGMAGAHESKKPFSSILGTIALERLTDIFGLLCMVFFASKVLAAEYLPFHIIIPIIVAGIFCVGALIFVSKKIKPTNETQNPSWGDKLKSVLTKFTAGFHSIKSPRQILSIGGLALIIWMSEALVAMILSRFFGLNLSFWQASALIVGTSLGVIIPAAPGYVGTFEFFAQQTLVLLGFPAGPALAFVLVWHFMQFVVVGILGLPYIIQSGGLPKNLISKTEKDSIPL